MPISSVAAQYLIHPPDRQKERDAWRVGGSAEKEHFRRGGNDELSAAMLELDEAVTDEDLRTMTPSEIVTTLDTVAHRAAAKMTNGEARLLFLNQLPKIRSTGLAINAAGGRQQIGAQGASRGAGGGTADILMQLLGGGGGGGGAFDAASMPAAGDGGVSARMGTPAAAQPPPSPFANLSPDAAVIAAHAKYGGGDGSANIPEGALRVGGAEGDDAGRHVVRDAINDRPAGPLYGISDPTQLGQVMRALFAADGGMRAYPGFVAKHGRPEFTDGQGNFNPDHSMTDGETMETLLRGIAPHLRAAGGDVEKALLPFLKERESFNPAGGNPEELAQKTKSFFSHMYPNPSEETAEVLGNHLQGKPKKLAAQLPEMTPEMACGHSATYHRRRRTAERCAVGGGEQPPHPNGDGSPDRDEPGAAVQNDVGRAPTQGEWKSAGDGMDLPFPHRRIFGRCRGRAGAATTYSPLLPI